MAVLQLCGRPLTHFRSLSMKNLNPFIALFLSFSSRKLAERLHKGKKVRWFDGRHTESMGASICKKTDSLGAQSLTSPASARLCLFLNYDLFFMRRDGFSIRKACSYIFYQTCVFESHVTWNSAVPDPNVWRCILLFLCTLASIYDFHERLPRGVFRQNITSIVSSRCWRFV